MPHCQVTIVACHNSDSLVGDVWLVDIRRLVSFVQASFAGTLHYFAIKYAIRHRGDAYAATYICYEFNFDEGEFALYALPSATHNFNNFEIADSVAK